MNEFFHELQSHWSVIVLSILSSIVTILTGIVAFLGAVGVWRKYRGVYRSLPTDTHVHTREDGQPIVLGVQHCRAPRWHELKGVQVVATGIITNLHHGDTKLSSMELHAFPFTIPATIVCEFAQGESHALESLDMLNLVSVVGTADENMESGDAMSSRCKLRLTSCRVQRPRFLDWLRYAWVGSTIREWWYFR